MKLSHLSYHTKTAPLCCHSHCLCQTVQLQRWGSKKENKKSQLKLSIFCTCPNLCSKNISLYFLFSEPCLIFHSFILGWKFSSPPSSSSPILDWQEGCPVSWPIKHRHISFFGWIYFFEQMCNIWHKIIVNVDYMLNTCRIHSYTYPSNESKVNICKWVLMLMKSVILHKCFSFPWPL